MDESLDPLHLVKTIDQRYQELWDELTGVEEFPGSESQRIEGRVRRLNALGFDVAELDIHTSPDGQRISIQPMVVDAGHHSRRMMRLTGLDVEEHQAQRLLNDLDTFRMRTNQQQVDESVVAHQWLRDCFEPVVSAIPKQLRGKRDPAQLYHELLEYRWFQSEREKRDVPTAEAAGYPGRPEYLFQEIAAAGSTSAAASCHPCSSPASVGAACLAITSQLDTAPGAMPIRPAAADTTPESAAAGRAAGPAPGVCPGSTGRSGSPAAALTSSPIRLILGSCLRISAMGEWYGPTQPATNPSPAAHHGATANGVTLSR